MGLVSKLAEVMGTCGWIQKSGYNEFHKYAYAQEADIVNKLRGELSKRSVMIFPDVKEVRRTEHTTETMKWNPDTRQKEQSTRKTYLTEIMVEWTFVDGESGESRTVCSHGVGEDNMDKGFYKAFTGCEKYMLMKTFLLPTGDDPEKDSQEEKETAKQVGKVAAADTAQKKIAAYEAKKTTGNVTIADLEKAIGNVPGARANALLNQDVSQVETTPQLTVVQTGVDKYEIAGAAEVMNTHREILAACGKRGRSKDGKPLDFVVMTAEGLDMFKREFVENRKGILTPLKATWAKS